MQRFALAVIVSVLGFSVSGVHTLLSVEPCAFEDTRGTDRDCPPTCLTCGCCAQAAEPSLQLNVAVIDLPVASADPLTYRLLDADPRDVLHVPKTLVL